MRWNKELRSTWSTYGGGWGNHTHPRQPSRGCFHYMSGKRVLSENGFSFLLDQCHANDGWNPKLQRKPQQLQCPATKYNAKPVTLMQSGLEPQLQTKGMCLQLKSQPLLVHPHCKCFLMTVVNYWASIPVINSPSIHPSIPPCSANGQCPSDGLTAASFLVPRPMFPWKPGKRDGMGSADRRIPMNGLPVAAGIRLNNTWRQMHGAGGRGMVGKVLASPRIKMDSPPFSEAALTVLHESTMRWS